MSNVRTSSVQNFVGGESVVSIGFNGGNVYSCAQATGWTTSFVTIFRVVPKKE